MGHDSALADNKPGKISVPDSSGGLFCMLFSLTNWHSTLCLITEVCNLKIGY